MTGIFLQPGDFRMRTSSFIVSCRTLGGHMSILVTTTKTGTLRARARPRCSGGRGELQEVRTKALGSYLHCIYQHRLHVQYKLAHLGLHSQVLYKCTCTCIFRNRMSLSNTQHIHISKNGLSFPFLSLKCVQCTCTYLSSCQ